MREQLGKDIWARRTLEKIRSMGETESIVIDGIRNIEEIDAFKRELGRDFIVIAVAASSETRQKRALKRGRQDDSKDRKVIKERGRRELSWGLGVVIAYADIVVSNEGSVDEFRDEIRKILDGV